MKKRIVLNTLVVLLMISGLSFALTDITEHWGKTYIRFLIDKGAITGYPDHTFKPENSITVGEFSKILVSLLGHDTGNAPSGHWAHLYMQKAHELGLILKREAEFSAYDDAINRGMIARMIHRAMPENYDDLSDYLNQIKDYKMLKNNNRQAVLAVFRAGIVTGYPDGTFKDLNVATRAEASAMLVRYLDKTQRKIPVVVEEAIDYTGGIEMPSGVELAEYNEPGRYNFYASLNISYPLKPQYADVKKFLMRWLDQKTIDDIMALVKTKTKRQDGFRQNFYYKGKYIHVGSNKHNYIMEIKGFSDKDI